VDEFSVERMVQATIEVYGHGLATQKLEEHSRS
jgi:hypothetical protein